MPRFCAAFGPSAPEHVAAMGGEPAFSRPAFAFGLLTGERPGRGAGPYVLDDAPDLVAAGEVTVYNRRELLDWLSSEEAPPAGCSDGELLLRCYRRAGPEAFARVRGMFALAVWDGRHLTLARDPLGARTLFFARAEGVWAASSALRALRRWPPLPARLNLAAVRSFLTFAYLPGDETLLDGVTEVLPGCSVRLLEDGTSESVNYWEPCEGELDPHQPPGVYGSRLRSLLEEATRLRLPEGRDVGVFLSGGLDSSIVTALAARLHDRPVNTYAISFGDALPNELAYSSLVAAHCRTRHQILSFTGEQVAAHLAETTARLDCPVGDPLTVPNRLLARAAARDGLDVILNGEGGDPIFGGPKNLPMLLYELQRETLDPGEQSRAYLYAYRKCYEDLPQLLTADVHRALRDAPPLERLVEPFFATDRCRSYLNKLLYLNTRTKGAHHILSKVERLTSSCGIEGRAPLFDRAVVEYAFAIPPALKLAGTSEKWVLKRAARGLLPETIVDRPKSGMRVPVQHWLRGPLRALAHDLLLGRRAAGRGLFRPEIIRAWLRGEGSVWPRQGGKLWLVLTLELWLRSFLDGE